MPYVPDVSTPSAAKNLCGCEKFTRLLNHSRATTSYYNDEVHVPHMLDAHGVPNRMGLVGFLFVLDVCYLHECVRGVHEDSQLI